MNNYARIFLNPKEERELLQGFPWVYDNEISHVKYYADDGSGWKDSSLKECKVEDGSGIEIFTKAGGFIGTGIINRTSKITIRIISQDHADQIFADTKIFWEKRIQNAASIRNLHYKEDDSYRLIFGEADFIPGLIVERFCDINKNVYLVVQFLSLSCDVFKEDIINALEKICKPKGIYERDDAGIREKEGLPEKAGWIKGSEDKETTIVIKENDLLLTVDIAHGQKTGYFLDQKENRKIAAQFCNGKRVLDTFTHTGAFGLNAFKGGAKEVISVDISDEAVKIVNKNIKLNKAEDKMTAVCADVFDLLKKYEAEEKKFDVIILDPPAFTKSAKMIEKAYGGYKEINLRAMRLLTKGGILVTCSCSYFFDSNTFYDMIMHAAMDSHKHVQILEKRGAGMDHPVLMGYPKSEYLKCAICRVL